MREEVEITNYGLDATEIVVELRVDVDFADLFEVKESRVVTRSNAATTAGAELHFTTPPGAPSKEVIVATAPAAAAEPRLLTWTSTLAPRATWRACVEVRVAVGGALLGSRFACGAPDDQMLPSRRLESWRATLPSIETDDVELRRAVSRAADDLGALRIFDPDHPDTPILAAGAPWFMTVFGRDSLLTGWMTLLADPTLARGVLETLARFQGTDVDPRTEEEPGRILHEIRFGQAGGMSLGGGDRYFGTIDATPLFVMLLGELQRWGADDDVVAHLLPHADRALAWVDGFGDRDGDGYVEYARRDERGLVNQGWKDSWDAIRFADGALADPPIALCEVQGYVYAAFVARHDIAVAAGDVETAAHYRSRALDLRRRFNEDFWIDELGCFALGLDADKRPIDAVASNMGHCLWTGIVDEDKAALVAARLVSDDLFSGWGIRTLGTSMRAYNPVSYHNGSVWPHDNAIAVAGLARYGFVDEAHRVIAAQLDVAATKNGRLPELFAGFERGDPPSPAAYPTSCSPQAWAAASPLLWLRALLRLDPRSTTGEVWLQPELPAWLDRLRIDGLRVGGQRLSIAVDGDGCTVEGDGTLAVVSSARPADGLGT